MNQKLCKGILLCLKLMEIYSNVIFWPQHLHSSFFASCLLPLPPSAAPSYITIYPPFPPLRRSFFSSSPFPLSSQVSPFPDHLLTLNPSLPAFPPPTFPHFPGFLSFLLPFTPIFPPPSLHPLLFWRCEYGRSDITHSSWYLVVGNKL